MTDKINFEHFGNGALQIVSKMTTEEISKFDALFKQFDVVLKDLGYTDMQIAAGHFMQMQEYSPRNPK